VTTVLQYLVIAAVIGLVVFGIAVFVFGRGEQMAALSPRTSPTELPDHDLTADDVRKVRFAMALRGYRMSDVDWALEKMADELDRLRAEVAELSAGETAAPVLAGVGSTGTAQGERPVASRSQEPVTGGTDRPDPSSTELSGDR
jgi:DivIVA domain-containing protein